MVKVDYDFYTEVYYGETISDVNLFEKLNRVARSLVNKHTFGRIDGELDSKDKELVKITICELIEFNYNKSLAPSYVSQTVGPHSITLDKKLTERESLLEQVNIIKRNLYNTDLLYRGVR